MVDPEIRRELSQLSRDLAKGLSAVRFMVESNTGRIKKLERLGVEGKLAAIEERLRHLNEKVEGLRDQDRETTGRIRTLEIGDAQGHKEVEKSRIRWGAVVPIGVAVFSGVASLVIQLITAMGK